MNKDIVTPLIGVLGRHHSELVMFSLRFLRKIALLPVIWSELPFAEIIPAITHNIFPWAGNGSGSIGVLRESLELLIAFSRHPETLPEFEVTGVFPAICLLADIAEIRPHVVCLLYHYFIGSDGTEPVRSEAVLGMLCAAALGNCAERPMAQAVLAHLSLDRQCALTIGRSRMFASASLRGMFIDATAQDGPANHLILRLIRNVAEFQPELATGFDDELISSCLVPGRAQGELLSILSVANRVKMSSERAKYFTSHRRFMDLLARALWNKAVNAQLHLEVIIFIAAVCLFSDAAKAVLDCGIVAAVAARFLARPDDLDTEVQCLFAFHRFACHAGTRAELLKETNILEAIVRLAASTNAIVNRTANAVIEVIISFDSRMAAKMQGPRFDSFNSEWLEAVADVQ
jgi:hypothetical protein